MNYREAIHRREETGENLLRWHGQEASAEPSFASFSFARQNQSPLHVRDAVFGEEHVLRAGKRPIPSAPKQTRCLWRRVEYRH